MSGAAGEREQKHAVTLEFSSGLLCFEASAPQLLDFDPLPTVLLYNMEQCNKLQALIE